MNQTTPGMRSIRSTITICPGVPQTLQSRPALLPRTSSLYQASEPQQQEQNGGRPPLIRCPGSDPPTLGRVQGAVPRHNHRRSSFLQKREKTPTLMGTFSLPPLIQQPLLPTQKRQTESLEALVQKTEPAVQLSPELGSPRPAQPQLHRELRAAPQLHLSSGPM